MRTKCQVNKSLCTGLGQKSTTLTIQYFYDHNHKQHIKMLAIVNTRLNMGPSPSPTLVTCPIANGNRWDEGLGVRVAQYNMKLTYSHCRSLVGWASKPGGWYGHIVPMSFLGPLVVTSVHGGLAVVHNRRAVLLLKERVCLARCKVCVIWSEKRDVSLVIDSSNLIAFPVLDLVCSFTGIISIL